MSAITRSKPQADRAARRRTGRKARPRSSPAGSNAAQLRALLATAVDAIITIDQRGLIQSINPAGERMFGYTARELIGRNVSTLMPAPFGARHSSQIARYLRTGEKRVIGYGREASAKRRDGSVFAIDLAVSEVERGKLFTGIIRDISDRKLIEARVREADRLASIGALAAGLGHDMNNVLLPVRARLNALLAEGNAAFLPARIRDQLAEIRKSAAYLQQLADGLHFLAMDPEKEGPEGETSDVAEWWAQAGALLSQAVPKHVRVTASIPHGLPRIRVAAHRLTQAALNLIVNAGDAIPADRKRRQGIVRVWARAQGGGDGRHRVSIGVTDNGRGMTDDVRRHAFDMFFTTKPRGLGTGLGLTMVRKVVERAAGSVAIDTVVGRGTTVTMTFPALGHHASSSAGPALHTAVISTHNTRAAALIRNFLESARVKVRVGEKPGRADLWITEGATLNRNDANAWLSACPEGRLVLIGGSASYAGFRADFPFPIIINNADDFEAVRTALGRALSQGQSGA